MSSGTSRFLRRVAACTAFLAGVAVLVTVWPAPARAKAPAARDMPTLEQIFQEAQAARDEVARLAAEAARDPYKEAIEGYRSGASDLADFKALTDIVNNSKSDELQVYRTPAATAILDRFGQENLDDPAIRRVRSALALEIIDLMKANSSDQVGLSIIEEVLQTWWRTKLSRDIRFRASDKSKARIKAWRKMRAYLQNGERG